MLYNSACPTDPVCQGNSLREHEEEYLRNLNSCVKYQPNSHAKGPVLKKLVNKLDVWRQQSSS